MFIWNRISTHACAWPLRITSGRRTTSGHVCSSLLPFNNARPFRCCSRGEIRPIWRRHAEPAFMLWLFFLYKHPAPGPRCPAVVCNWIRAAIFIASQHRLCHLGPQVDEQRRLCRKTSGLHKSGSFVYLTCLLSPFRSYRNSNYASFSPLFAILHNAKICELLENGKLPLPRSSHV